MAPGTAALLSMVVPGLGQAVVGRRLRGLVLALPAVAAALGVVVLLGRSPADLLGIVARREFLLAILALDLVLLGWHVLAVVDAWRVALPRRRGGPAAAQPGARARVPAVLLAIALTGTLLGHGVVGWVAVRAADVVPLIFGGPGGGVPLIPEPGFESPSPWPTPWPSPSASPSPLTPTPTPTPARTPTPAPTAGPSLSPSPSPTPSPPPVWARDGRLDVLLIGSDAGPDRWSLRTDTLIVLSVDVATGRAALFGIPRNLINVPLPPESAGAFPGGRFPGLLNALYVYAIGHPAQFPGGDARGFRAVSGAVQELVGVRLDGLAVVRLQGFVRLIDAIGGLWIDVPERLVDSAYPLEDGSGRYISLDFRPGCQHLDGRLTLAYARSRRQDSDYGRMRRQQQVLLALRRQIEPLELVVRVPELLDIAGSSFWMTFTADDLPALAALAADVPVSRVTTRLFVPRRYPSQLDDAAIAAVRRVVRTVFETPLPPDNGTPPGADTCP